MCSWFFEADPNWSKSHLVCKNLLHLPWKSFGWGANSVSLLIENWNYLNLVLYRVARQFCKSHFSTLKSKLREINPSLHSIKRLKVVAEATALASPAPVHRGRTPYDMAKEFGHQKVMGLLHPVPQPKAVEEWGMWWIKKNTWGSCWQKLVPSMAER